MIVTVTMNIESDSQITRIFLTKTSKCVDLISVAKPSFHEIENFEGQARHTLKMSHAPGKFLFAFKRKMLTLFDPCFSCKSNFHQIEISRSKIHLEYIIRQWNGKFLFVKFSRPLGQRNALNLLYQLLTS